MAATPEPRVITGNNLVDRISRRIVSGLTRMGISLLGSRVLYVRGRKSGEWRTTPVNLLKHEGELADGAVLVQARHGGELGLGDALGVGRGHQTVRVAGVAHIRTNTTNAGK